MSKSADKMARDFQSRFWAKVDVRPDGCWLWTGHLDGSGYGRFAVRVNGRTFPAQAKHVAWEIIKATPLPAGAQLNHSCDVPACVNPAHLYIGTQQENMRDRWARTGSRKPPMAPPEAQRPITAIPKKSRLCLAIGLFLLFSYLPCGASRLHMTTPQFHDSRKAWQFRASVVGWLEWRSGSAWRPASDRFHPDRFDFVSAINFMNEAWASPEVCACPYCAGAPFAGERKPVASATVFRASSVK